MTPPPPPPATGRQALDTNGDGAITAADLEVALPCGGKSGKRGRCSTEGCGCRGSDNGGAAALDAHAAAVCMVEEADKDHDGAVDWKEVR